MRIRRALTLVWEKALRHDWPVTLGPGIAAASTRPGRALIGFCDWIETDFSAGHLRRLLQSGDLGIEEDDEGFKAGQAARTLARAEAGWGRATYGLSLGAAPEVVCHASRRSGHSDDEREAAADREQLTGKISLTGSTGSSRPFPRQTEGRSASRTSSSASIAFLERTTARAECRSIIVPASALLEHVTELRALGAFSLLAG